MVCEPYPPHHSISSWRLFRVCRSIVSSGSASRSSRTAITCNVPTMSTPAHYQNSSMPRTFVKSPYYSWRDAELPQPAEDEVRLELGFLGELEVRHPAEQRGERRGQLD